MLVQESGFWVEDHFLALMIEKREKMVRKIKKKRGFTLMEMLIVVAIMVVLLGVSLPLYSVNLDTSRTAADDANLRAAKSVANMQYLLKENTFSSAMYFDLTTESFVTEPPSPGYGKSSANLDKVISAVWDSEANMIVLTWE